MKLKNLGTWVLVATVSSVSMAACGGDDDALPTAGTGGGGSGGTTGGKGGGSGRGGSPGGHGGEAGEPQAGAGQTGAGAPGTGGSGAVSGGGGSGGGGGSMMSTAGAGAEEAGGADNGGAGGAPETELKACVVGCQMESDCQGEFDKVRHCDVEFRRCVECNTHADCVPIASGWQSTCTMDDDCFVAFGEVCVNVMGFGHCAAVPDEPLGCLFPGEAPVTLPKFGVTPTELVDVCGKDSGRCENRRCFTGCTDDPNFCTTGLTAGHGDTCDTASGRCTCQADSECAHGPQHCNPVTHLCDECADATDCSGAAAGKDVCVDGRCGCSSASVCSTGDLPGSAICE